MVVLLIIGIGAATVRLMVAKSDPIDDVVGTANTFQYWFSQQLDQSLLTHEEIGLYFMESSIAVLSWHEGDPQKGEDTVIWNVENEVNYANDTDDLVVELMQNIEALEWVPLEPDIIENTTLIPHVIIFPSEEYQPSFQLNFKSRDYFDEYMSIIGDGFNRLRVKRETQ